MSDTDEFLARQFALVRAELPAQAFAAALMARIDGEQRRLRRGRLALLAAGLAGAVVVSVWGFGLLAHLLDDTASSAAALAALGAAGGLLLRRASGLAIRWPGRLWRWVLAA